MKHLSTNQPTPISTSINRKDYNQHIIVEYLPSDLISEGSTIELNVLRTTTDYNNLNKSRLHIKAKITIEDCRAITLTDNSVGLVNLSLHSLFRQAMSCYSRKISPQI